MFCCWWYFFFYELFVKKQVELVEVVEMAGYYTHSPTTFTTSYDFLLFWEIDHGIVCQHAGMDLEIVIGIVPKMLDWHLAPSMHPNGQKMHVHVWYWTANDAVTLGVTLNIFHFCLPAHTCTGMPWLALQLCRVTLVTLVTLLLHCLWLASGMGVRNYSPTCLSN